MVVVNAHDRHFWAARFGAELGGFLGSLTMMMPRLTENVGTLSKTCRKAQFSPKSAKANCIFLAE